MTLHRSLILLLTCYGLSSCSGETEPLPVDTEPTAPETSEETTETEVDLSGAPSDTHVFTHKMMRNSEEAGVISIGYECSECTFEQWLSIDPPDGWSKGPAQILLAQEGEMRGVPELDGVEASFDFLPEVPGNEYQAIVKNLEARPIAAVEGGIVAEARVMRNTLLTFQAGRRVHELTDAEGRVFVLFAVGVDPTHVVIPDTDAPSFMVDFTAPEGWTYASRVLEEDLHLDTPDTTTVLAFRGTMVSTWELR